MTVYDFMKKMGDYSLFHIIVDDKDITNDELVCLADIRQPYYDNTDVLCSLELKAVMYDIETNSIYVGE